MVNNNYNIKSRGTNRHLKFLVTNQNFAGLYLTYFGKSVKVKHCSVNFGPQGRFDKKNCASTKIVLIRPSLGSEIDPIFFTLSDLLIGTNKSQQNVQFVTEYLMGTSIYKNCIPYHWNSLIPLWLVPSSINICAKLTELIGIPLWPINRGSNVTNESQSPWTSSNVNNISCLVHIVWPDLIWKYVPVLVSQLNRFL